MKRLRLADMTAQQVFDAVVARARDGRGVCIGEGGYCRYRGPNGNVCFVGALIGDDEYKPSMEGSVEFLSSGVGEHVLLLIDLQSVHDNFPQAVWERELFRVADKHRLTYTPPTDADE